MSWRISFESFDASSRNTHIELMMKPMKAGARVSLMFRVDIVALVQVVSGQLLVLLEQKLYASHRPIPRLRVCDIVGVMLQESYFWGHTTKKKGNHDDHLRRWKRGMSGI